jgi:hydrogenase maturation protein HypF
MQGCKEAVESFFQQLENIEKKPALLKIDTLKKMPIPVIFNETGFCIHASHELGAASAAVCPDIAVCLACLAEIRDSADFRYHYPFINCTQCGPRYSIIKTIPYDRLNTTMADFAMCPQCRSQYENVVDRRFHAQPVACPVCGPHVSLLDNQGKAVETQSDSVLAKAAALLREGKILAIKGIGGFHLAVDAFNDNAVKLLRQRKRREVKPFAMMAVNLDMIWRFVVADSAAEELLTSPSAPIVLLDKKEPSLLAAAVAEGTNRYGFMLPYAPLHHLLFAEPGIEVLVMTSANLSDEPLICENAAALEQLNTVADYFLVHDRPIYRQVDDSVMHIIDGKPAFLRRSRGYVPETILRRKAAAKAIFAAGADMKNTFCFLKGDRYILSEHIGDMEKPSVYRHYIRSIDHLAGLFEVVPQVVACDLHPGYFSTQYAQGYACKNGIESIVRVQHHWAHAASAMAEFNLDQKVIALIADGTGYGTDGAIWGCECLVCSLTEFERLGHLAYYPLAGGDLASIEAIRSLLGLCQSSGIELPKCILRRIEPDEQKVLLIRQQIEKNIATVPSSSLGRLFDAMAALVGCGNHNHFEAQLPMAMEAIADSAETGVFPVEVQGYPDGTFGMLPRTIIVGILDDLERNIDKTVISARFHNTIAEGLKIFAVMARQKTGIRDVVLSGGVFCNRYLSNRLIRLLQESGFRVFFKSCVPVNDGGIAIGQAAIAAATVKMTD